MALEKFETLDLGVMQRAFELNTLVSRRGVQHPEPNNGLTKHRPSHLCTMLRALRGGPAAHLHGAGAAPGLPGAGPARYCPPRHRTPFDSRHEGAK